MFLDEDTDAALALQQYEDLTCGGCGQPREESMDPANEGKYKVRLVTCHACAEQIKRQEDLADNPEPGVHLRVERIRDQEGHRA